MPLLLQRGDPLFDVDEKTRSDGEHRITRAMGRLLVGADCFSFLTGQGQVTLHAADRKVSRASHVGVVLLQPVTGEEREQPVHDVLLRNRRGDRGPAGTCAWTVSAVGCAPVHIPGLAVALDIGRQQRLRDASQGVPARAHDQPGQQPASPPPPLTGPGSVAGAQRLHERLPGLQVTYRFLADHRLSGRSSRDVLQRVDTLPRRCGGSWCTR